MFVKAVAFSVRLPESADCDSAPLPVVAPVLTPMSSIVAAPVGRPEPGVYMIERIWLSRSWSSGSPYSVPCVGSVLDGCCWSWV